MSTKKQSVSGRSIRLDNEAGDVSIRTKGGTVDVRSDKLDIIVDGEVVGSIGVHFDEEEGEYWEIKVRSKRGRKVALAGVVIDGDDEDGEEDED